MIERIKKIMVEENLSSSKFADEIGIINSRLSHYLSGRNNVSLDLIMKILERFRGINPEWLMFGRGEMYKSPDSRTTNVERDLFSSPVIEDSPTQMEKENPVLNDMDDSDINEEEHETHLASDNSIESQPIKQTQNFQALKHGNGQKRIEKILVMYDDSTFDCYTPNGQHI